MIEQIAIWIGYGVMGIAGVALFLGLLYVAITWWEYAVILPRCKFDGKGNIVRK